MGSLRKNARLTLDGLISSLIWSSILAMGVMLSSTLVRLGVVGGLKVYRLMHS